MVEIVIMVILCIFWTIVALYVFKIYCSNRACTKPAKGLLMDLKFEDGFKIRTVTGKLSYKTEGGKKYNLNYKKGIFVRLPFSYTDFNSLCEPKEVTVMYDPKCPGIHYIKDGYWGLVAVILPSIFSLISLFLTVYFIINIYL